MCIAEIHKPESVFVGNLLVPKPWLQVYKLLEKVYGNG